MYMHIYIYIYIYICCILWPCAQFFFHGLVARLARVRPLRPLLCPHTGPLVRSSSTSVSPAGENGKRVCCTAYYAYALGFWLLAVGWWVRLSKQWTVGTVFVVFQFPLYSCSAIHHDGACVLVNSRTFMASLHFRAAVMLSKFCSCFSPGLLEGP